MRLEHLQQERGLMKADILSFRALHHLHHKVYVGQVPEFVALWDESPGDESTCDEPSARWTDRVESTCDESKGDEMTGNPGKTRFQNDELCIKWDTKLC